MKKAKKSKVLFPYGYEYREVIGYSIDGKKTPLYRIKRIFVAYLDISLIFSRF